MKEACEKSENYQLNSKQEQFYYKSLVRILTVMKTFESLRYEFQETIESQNKKEAGTATARHEVRKT